MTDEKQIVNLLPLKKFASTKLKNHKLLYRLILEENDTIPVNDFLVKGRVWLKILEKNLEEE